MPEVMNSTISGVAALNNMGSGGMVVVVTIVLSLVLLLLVYSLWKWGRWAIKGALILASAAVPLGVAISIFAFLFNQAEEIVYEHNYTLPIMLGVAFVGLTACITVGKWVETGKSRPAAWMRKQWENTGSPAEKKQEQQEPDE